MSRTTTSPCIRGVPNPHPLAIDAALRMGQAGDLLLVFADALTRSWKQVIKFRPEGAPAAKGAVIHAKAMDTPPPVPAVLREDPAQDLEGLIRDERGVRFARESED